MSLAEILGAIRAGGEAQCEEIERDARMQQRAILAEARAKAADIKEEAFTATVRPADRERARILHHAHLEALRIVAEVREALIGAALSQARGQLASFRNSQEYPQVLQSLALQALEELQESFGREMQACMQADPRDREYLEAILARTGLDIHVAYDLNSWGGVIVQSHDQRVVVVNTLEARLERALPYLRRYLSAQLEASYPEKEFSRGMEEVKA